MCSALQSPCGEAEMASWDRKLLNCGADKRGTARWHGSSMIFTKRNLLLNYGTWKKRVGLPNPGEHMERQTGEGRHCLSWNWVLPCSSASKYSHQGLSSTPPLSRTLSALLSQLVSLASPNPAALSVQRAHLPYACKGKKQHMLALCSCARTLPLSSWHSLPAPPAPLTQPACSPPRTPSHCLCSSRGWDKPDPKAGLCSDSVEFSRNSPTRHASPTHASSSSPSPHAVCPFCPSFPNYTVSFPVSVAKIPFHDFAIIFLSAGFREHAGNKFFAFNLGLPLQRCWSAFSPSLLPTAKFSL